MALMQAICTGNNRTALNLINGADVNIANMHGQTALMKAVDYGNKEIALALIDEGADVNIADNDGQTPLMKSADYGNDHIAIALINGGADMDIVDEGGETALMKAAHSGNSAIAQELIKRGAEINTADNDGQTALMRAAYRGNNKIALALINEGADVNIADNVGRTALITAAYQGRNEISLALINGGADVNIADNDGQTALIKAVDLENNKIALALIKGGADLDIVDKGGETAFMKAACRGNNEIALALIDEDADVNIANEAGETALMKAAFYGNNKIVSALINRGADLNIVDNKGQTALMKAADCENNNTALALINRCFNVKFGDNDHETALIKVAYSERNKVTFALISGGADLNIADGNGVTVLMLAANHGNNEIVQALINGGADVSIGDYNGKTALMYAIKHREVVTTLLKQRKTLVNAFDKFGRTALFYAIEENDLTRYLIENGANVYVTDIFNVNGLSFAIYYCIKIKSTPSQIRSMVEVFKEEGIEQQAIVSAIINALFCKCMSDSTKSILPMLEFVCEFMEETDPRKESIQSIIQTVDNHIFPKLNYGLLSVLNILSLLTDLGADPNSADENGNTACHYVTRLICDDLLNIELWPWEVVEKIYQNVGFAVNKKNSNHETPLLFYFKHALNVYNSVPRRDPKYIFIGNLVKFCDIFLKIGADVNESLKNGMSVFHLVTQIAQEMLDARGQCYTLKQTDNDMLQLTELLQLFSTPRVKKNVTVNKFDEDMNTPLHYWASLSLPSIEDYIVEENRFIDQNKLEHFMAVILKHLMKCGALLNSRNLKGETPLHRCKTWSAVKLLVAAGANTNDVDRAGRSPLLTAAQSQLFVENPGYFYPDVTDDSTTFWKIVSNMGFDIFGSDENGDSLISNLVGWKAFVLAKGLVTVLCNENLRDEAAVDVLNAICKDESFETTWKILLVQMILKSRRRPIDLSSCLHLCCINILDGISPNKVRGTSSYVRGNRSVRDSVHWQVAEQLLWYGASGERCLDLANSCVDSCPDLKDLLTNPPSTDELPMVIPWTAYSINYEKKLAEVARRKNCKTVEGTTYWHHNEYIASGTFGHVFAGINEKDGMEVAIKRIEKLRLVRPEDKREIRIFPALTDCKQIVQYLASFESKDFSYLILELMEGNLDDYFGSAAYDSAKNTTLSKDVIMGLKYLHDRNIIHRDLKPSNILYKTHPNLCLKIADFGLSRPDVSNFSVSVMSTSVGTRGWIAPEVVKSSTSDHSKSSDIFSCGLIIHYMFSSQQHPFDPAVCTGKSKDEILIEREGNILKNSMEGWNSSLSVDVSHLVKQMLQINEKERPSASDSLDHPVFWSLEKKMDLLFAVGNQPEFEPPRSKRPSKTPLENKLEGSIFTIVPSGKWNDVGYAHMPSIFAEMTKPIVKVKKGKPYTVPPRKYDTGSVVELLRFIRNTIAHVSGVSLSSTVRDLILSQFAFLTEFPNLVMEVYLAVIKYGWDSRDEIKCVIKN